MRPAISPPPTTHCSRPPIGCTRPATSTFTKRIRPLRLPASNAILALPANRGAPRRELFGPPTCWDAIAAASGDVADATSAKFTATRKLALQGAPDPLGLAVASFGEEAKLHYDHARTVC